MNAGEGSVSQNNPEHGLIQTPLKDKSRESLPLEVRGWSWGAFFLPWIWGVGNRVWVSLLTLGFLIGLELYSHSFKLDYNSLDAGGVSLFGSFMILGYLVNWFTLAIKGRQWAWQKGTWRDVEHFMRV